MRIFLNILTVLFSTLTIFFVLSLYLGRQNGAIDADSSARLGLQIYGGLSALLALGFGLWGRAKDKTNRQATSRSATFGIISGVLSLSVLMWLSFFG